MNLNHLHLHVKDRPAAEKFYSDWFKLAVSRRGQCLTFLTDGKNFDLALMDDEAPQPLPAWFHFGFHLERAGAVVALHDEMVRVGVTLLRPLYQDETLVSFRCADPDRYGIEIYWEAPGVELD